VVVFGNEIYFGWIGPGGGRSRRLGSSSRGRASQTDGADGAVTRNLDCFKRHWVLVIVTFFGWVTVAQV
jgi:hypothetical protein